MFLIILLNYVLILDVDNVGLNLLKIILIYTILYERFFAAMATARVSPFVPLKSDHLLEDNRPPQYVYALWAAGLR